MQSSHHFALAECTRLSPAERARLAAMAPVRRFADGQFVQQQGDPGTAFWAVIEGRVTVGRYAADGGFTVFGTLGPGDMFGELAFFTGVRSEEHTSELQSLMRISYAVFCLKKKKTHTYKVEDKTT